MKQDTFIGGLSAQFDATKAGVGQYRWGLNIRTGENVIEAAFRHRKITTPAGVKQALFAFDDTLIMIGAGAAYKLVGVDQIKFLQLTGLSSTADIIYHETVPAPSKTLVGPDKVPFSVVSTTPLYAVLQDGNSQPALLTTDLAIRAAKAYHQWSYDDPEYVPIGTLMAFSGSKLFIVDPNKTVVYQSVSGRPLDFVLAFNSLTGQPSADAKGTAVSVSTARLTAIKPAQSGGFVGTSRYQTYAAIPETDFLIYDEPYLKPQTLFPVGCVGQNAFASVGGDTVYVSPHGVQLYNQTAQTLRESNLNPFGSVVASLIPLPIEVAAAITVNDFTFIALQTIFGPGILVYDAKIERFVGIDLTVGLVKEFAVLHDSTGIRLFYITTSHELYEIPLYSGERATAVVYFGEWCPVGEDGRQDASKLHKLNAAHFGLSDVTEAGYLSVTSYVNRRKCETKILPVPATLAAETTPRGSFPLGGSLPALTRTASFDLTPRGLTLGLSVEFSGAMRLLSFAVDTNEHDMPTAEAVTAIEEQTIAVVGGALATGRHTADFVSVPGRRYVLDASTTAAGTVTAGTTTGLTAGGHRAKGFVASADYAKLTGSARVWDYTDMLRIADGADMLFMLGDTDVTDTYKHLFTAVEDAGIVPYGVAGDYTRSNVSRAKDWFGCSAMPDAELISTDYIDFYCLNFPLTSGAPTELTVSGRFRQWVELTILERASRKKLNFLMVAVSPAENATLAAWPFARMGLHAVIAPGATYRNENVDGVQYLDIGQAARGLKISARPRAANLYYTDGNARLDSAYIVV